MKVLITGGTGFLGKQLAQKLVAEKKLQLDGIGEQTIKKIYLFDINEGEGIPKSSKVKTVVGDITNKKTLKKLVKKVDVIWHLAAVVSSAAEADFDLGMDVNLRSLMTLLEVLREQARKPRFIFASSCAIFGGELPEVVQDNTAVTPSSSYGTQKAVGELLVADYSRKGFIDARILRLPTVAIRPGKPNKAASTFVSSIIREPLQGLEAICPVNPDLGLFITSPRQCVESLVKAACLSADVLGNKRIIALPGLTVTVAQMLDALKEIRGEDTLNFIKWQADESVQRIVQSWPVRLNAAYAQSLGFTADKNIHSIIKAHIEDTFN